MSIASPVFALRRLYVVGGGMESVPDMRGPAHRVNEARILVAPEVIALIANASYNESVQSVCISLSKSRTRWVIGMNFFKYEYFGC